MLGWRSRPDIAGEATVSVTDLADAAPMDVAGVPVCGGGVVSWGDRLLPGVWC